MQLPIRTHSRLKEVISVPQRRAIISGWRLLFFFDGRRISGVGHDQLLVTLTVCEGSTLSLAVIYDININIRMGLG